MRVVLSLSLGLVISMAFAEELARYQELTPEERTARQENAADAISSWRQTYGGDRGVIP